MRHAPRRGAPGEAGRGAHRHPRQRGETDDPRLDLLKELVGRVGFLRIVTPKTGRGRHTREAGSFVMRDGEVVEGVGQTGGQRVADGKISMQEAHDYHNRLLRRQYFGKTPPPQPPML